MKPELVVDYNQSVWIFLDPADKSPEQWAKDEAVLCWQETGLEVTKVEVDHLAAVLLTAYKSLEHRSGFKFIHMPQPPQPGPVALVTAFDKEVDMTELEKTALDPTGNVGQPPKVTWVETPLGKGLRSHRNHALIEKESWFKPDTTSNFSQITFVWERPESNTQIMLECIGTPEEIQLCLADIDALAQSVRLENN